MAEEEKEKEENKNTNLIYLAILLIFAIATLVYKIIFKQSILLIGIGALIGAIVSVLSSKIKFQRVVINIVTYAIIFGAISYFSMPAYAEVNKLQKEMNLPTVPQMVQEAKKPFVCLFNYDECQKQYSQSYSYDSSKVQAGSKTYMQVNFPYNFVRVNQSVEIRGELTAMNQLFDVMHIDAKCSINNLSVSVNPLTLDIPKSSQEQYSVLTCSSDQYTKGDLALKLSAKYKAETVLPITLGSMGNIGKKVSEMKYDSPYKLSISVSYSQPLRNGNYVMYVVLEKQQQSTLTSIESLKVSTISEKARISCEKMQNLQISNLDRQALEQFVIPSKEIFLWQCNLDVENALDTPEEAYIQAEAIYTAESEYKTSLQIVK